MPRTTTTTTTVGSSSTSSFNNRKTVNSHVNIRNQTYKASNATCCNRQHITLRELASMLTAAMKTTKLGWDGGGGRPGRHMRVVLRNAAREGKIYGTKKVGTNKTARRSWFWHLDDADLITVQLLLAKHAKVREEGKKTNLSIRNNDINSNSDGVSTDACRTDDHDGAKKRKIDKIKKSNEELENECSICFENLYENDTTTNFCITTTTGGSSRNNIMNQTTRCGHTFHLICLQVWRKQNNSCPLCRQEC